MWLIEMRVTSERMLLVLVHCWVIKALEMFDVESTVDQALQAMPAMELPSTWPCESYFQFPSNTAHYLVKLPEDHHSNV